MTKEEYKAFLAEMGYKRPDHSHKVIWYINSNLTDYISDREYEDLDPVAKKDYHIMSGQEFFVWHDRYALPDPYLQRHIEISVNPG